MSKFMISRLSASIGKRAKVHLMLSTYLPKISMPKNKLSLNLPNGAICPVGQKMTP